jgi:hypothetical protein
VDFFGGDAVDFGPVDGFAVVGFGRRHCGAEEYIYLR